jgi:hypothetical protein
MAVLFPLPPNVGGGQPAKAPTGTVNRNGFYYTSQKVNATLPNRHATPPNRVAA